MFKTVSFTTLMRHHVNIVCALLSLEVFSNLSGDFPCWWTLPNPEYVYPKLKYTIHELQNVNRKR